MQKSNINEKNQTKSNVQKKVDIQLTERSMTLSDQTLQRNEQFHHWLQWQQFRFCQTPNQ